MSFGRFPRFDGDPFFSSNRDPFTMNFPSFPPMLGFPHQGGNHLHQDQNHRRLHGQIAMMANPFQSMFGDMRMMNSASNGSRGNNGGHFYSSSSSVMHFSNTGGGNPPQVYHATSSVTSGPGGVKETRKTECNSQSGMKKMAIGHHIGDRSHTVEKRENVRTKDREQHQHFVNLDESDASNFDSEWQKKSRHQPGLQSHDSERLASRRGIAGREHREFRSRSPVKRPQVPPPPSSSSSSAAAAAAPSVVPASTSHLPCYPQSEANRQRYSQPETDQRRYSQPMAGDRRQEHLQGRSRGDKTVNF